MCVTSRIRIKEYLKEYLISIYGSEPVRFPDDSDLLATLHDVRITRPRNAPDDEENNLEIVIPYQKIGKNARTHNYISRRGQLELQKKVQRLFSASLNEFVSDCRIKGYEYQASIEMFADLHNLQSISIGGLKKKDYRRRVKKRLNSVK